MARPLQRLMDVADAQWGLVTRQQAERAGVAWSSLARLARAGSLERVGHGVYRVRGAGAPDHRALSAAWLQLDPSKPAWVRQDDPLVAVVSHASAAALHAVGDLRADVHEFTLPVRRQSRRTDVRLHRGTVASVDRVVLDGLPTTRGGRTVADLLADHVDPSAVAGIAVEVLERMLDYPRAVVDDLAPYSTRFGFAPGDGVALLDHLLQVAGSRDRDRFLADAVAR
jgi:predicted transcriptional regulator of viral defense system